MNTFENINFSEILFDTLKNNGRIQIMYKYSIVIVAGNEITSEITKFRTMIQSIRDNFIVNIKSNN